MIVKRLLVTLVIGFIYAQSNSLKFDGENDYLSVNHSESLIIQDELTISTWIFPESYTNSSNPRIVQKGSSDNGYLLCFSGSGVQFKVEGLGSTNSSQRPPLNQWSHIVAIMNTDSLKIYANNQMITGINISGGVAPYDVLEEIYIGSKNGIDDLFDGQIFELNIWNKALSNFEIRQLFNRSEIPDQNNLALSLRDFDEESVNSALDRSGNENNANVYGIIVTTNVPNSPTYTNVPDDNFEQALIDLGYDDVLDDLVYTENINELTNLNLPQKGIVNLTGIQDFISLTELGVRFNQLTALDVTNLTSLTHLDLASNNLTTIDLSNNSSLQYLYVENNQLTDMNLEGINSLLQLKYNYNQLHDLDFTSNIGLKIIECTDNDLTSINLSGLAELEELVIFQNSLTNLDVSDNINLKYLNLGDNPVGTLDVSSNTNLNDLRCFNNNLLSLDVSNNTLLTYLEATNNSIASIDLSNNLLLQSVYCNNNQLISLDISNNTALQNLYCNDNQLTSVDVSSNPNLLLLLCMNNQITDLTLNTEIQNLYCGNNQLTSLDVSQTNLNILSCGSNQLSYLNIKTLENQLNSFNAQNNSLTCIETLDPGWASELWTSENGNIDNEVTFEVICGSEERTNWYVSTSGSDVFGNGTLDSPFETIQTAINAADDNCSILVQPGTYEERISYLGKHLRVIGDRASSTIIDGGERIGNNIQTINMTSSNDGQINLLKDVTVVGGDGNIRAEGNCIIDRCVVKDMNWQGSYPRAKGILLTNQNNHVSNSIIIDSGLEPYLPAVGLNYGTASLINCTVMNEQLEYDSSNLFIVSGPGEMNIVNSILIGDNIYKSTRFNGEHENSKLNIYHSIIDNGRKDVPGFYEEENGEEPEYTFTHFGQGKFELHYGNIFEDVELTDPENYDFSLVNPLPAISAGLMSLTTVDGILIEATTDGLNNVFRSTPEGTLPDIGPYEYEMGVNSYQGEVYYVDDDSDFGNGSLEAPFHYIQQGIDASQNDEILISVAEGVYNEAINFKGKNIIVQGESKQNTIIDAEQNALHVVSFISGETQAARLEKLTIKNGNASGSGDFWPNDAGGGILISGSEPEVADCNILNNFASSSGGGIAVRDGSVKAYNNEIENNSTNGEGGGIWIENSNASIIDYSNPKFNEAYIGAGIFIRNSDVLINNTYISTNVASDRGGGINVRGK